ncbi:M60 family metallopeptidase [Armatimonas sp.]|uniref:M60 family metallopeptidase n=1 Tax=Armatimonas sp. TaxID=1872638 RepID=UPI00286C6FED|nr:M60 family metallopeptidase [Armatimonas sp.]
MPFVVPVALYATYSNSLVRSPQTDQAALLAGVTELIAPSAIPGPLSVFGDNAFVVVAGRSESRRLPMIAASRFERGRAVAIGHDGFLAEEPLKHPDNTQFLLNAVRWVLAMPTATVAVVERPYVADILEKTGLKVVRLTTAQLQSQIESPDFDAVVMNAAALDDKAGVRLAQALTIFVRGGGGVVMDSLGWGWVQTHPGKTLGADHGGNKLFTRLGIAWADGYFEKTGEKGWKADSGPLELLQAKTALAALQSHADNTMPLSAENLAQVGQTLTSAIGPLPSDEPRFLPQVAALTKRFAGNTAFPIGVDQPVARLKTVLEQNAIRRGSGDRQPAHISSGGFPGVVAFDAPRLANQKVTVAGGVHGWQGTGLYAAPGAPLTISIPPALAGKGLSVRIGCHEDTLWNLGKWERFPEITLSRPINQPTFKLTSAFGGTVYIDVPEGFAKDTFTVTISGAVAAPRFVRGITPPADWRNSIRNAPGPWAELEGKNIILSVPSSVVRSLDDPEALMAYWDEVSDLAADLYQIPKNRPRPERYVVDKQISAGYMPAGYPIMTYTDEIARRFVDLSVLRGQKGEPNWGFYHELGHNHQREWWTWEGCGEVTNNLFSLYACEKLNGDRVGLSPMEPKTIREAMTKHLAAGAPYAKWKEDPFLALILFAQLKDAFGWETFKKVFAEYEKAPKESLPTTDQQKRDQFMTRFSRTVNKNLGPFFTAWGVPTSDAARSQIARLPRWMPKDWPKK